MANSGSEFHLPDEALTDQLLERVQFSVSSRNAQATVCDTVVYVFGASMADSPRQIDWKYVTSGVVAMLRHRELVKKKYMWMLNLCIYHIKHGVLVWNGKIPLNCNYTVVADNFHVLALGEGEGILGLMFQEEKAAGTFQKMVQEWIEEGHRDDKGGKASPHPPRVKFRKEMISKPCDFQHIQGSEALDQCLEIEAVKAQILKSLTTLKHKSRTENDGVQHRSRSKKKEAHKISMPFNQVEVPAAIIDKHENGIDSPDGHDSRENDRTCLAANGGPRSLPDHMVDDYRFQGTPPLVYSTSYVGGGASGSDNSQSSSHLGRLSPLNLEDEITASFAITSPSSHP